MVERRVYIGIGLIALAILLWYIAPTIAGLIAI